MSAFDLVIRLLETRAGNRRAVFTDCVLPLQQSIQELHISYLTGFHDILQELGNTGVTSDLHRRVAREFDRKVAERAELIGEYGAVRALARRKLDIEMPEVEAYLESVRYYLIANGLQERLVYVRNFITGKLYLTTSQLHAAAAAYSATEGPPSDERFLEWLAEFAVTEAEASTDNEAPSNTMAVARNPDFSKALDFLISSGAIGIDNPAYNRVRVSLSEEPDATRVASLINHLRDELQVMYGRVNIAFGIVKARLL